MVWMLITAGYGPKRVRQRVNDTSQRLEEERVIIREDSWVLMDWKREGMWYKLVMEMCRCMLTSQPELGEFLMHKKMLKGL